MSNHARILILLVVAWGSSALPCYAASWGIADGGDTSAINVSRDALVLDVAVQDSINVDGEPGAVGSCAVDTVSCRSIMLGDSVRHMPVNKDAFRFRYDPRKEEMMNDPWIGDILKAIIYNR
ncbi:MAG: hypothetical protein C7K11_04040 [Candidatus Amulumruptor caecigallinarius]|nr:MAG: hypothetical protein C7K11_04040 [Candidatus Amulumruptor caecigallinarius]